MKGVRLVRSVISSVNATKYTLQPLVPNSVIFLGKLPLVDLSLNLQSSCKRVKQITSLSSSIGSTDIFIKKVVLTGPIYKVWGGCC